jgi:hypothetical protein
MRYQLKKPAGRQYYDLRWTDKSGRHKKGTGKQTKGEAEAWAIQFFNDYVPGESGKLTVGDLVENFLAVQKVKYPSRHVNAVYPWETRMKDKFAHIDARALSGRDTLNYINWCIGVELPGWAPLEQPLAKATANKDVAILQGAYTHAKKADDFRHRPHFSTHDVSDNVREGSSSKESSMPSPPWSGIWDRIIYGFAPT